MDGIKLICWFILSYGLMNIMVFGSIFEGFRNFFKNWGNNGIKPFNSMGSFISGLLSCPMCFSTWGGFVLSYLIYSPSFEIFGINHYYSWFIDGILSSGAVWIINSIVEWFESKNN